MRDQGSIGCTLSISPLCPLPSCPQFPGVNEKYELDMGVTGKNSQKPGWNIPFLKYIITMNSYILKTYETVRWKCD